MAAAVGEAATAGVGGTSVPAGIVGDGASVAAGTVGDGPPGVANGTSRGRAEQLKSRVRPNRQARPKSTSRVARL